jgi:hypothetical protein
MKLTDLIVAFEIVFLLALIMPVGAADNVRFAVP